MPLVLVTQFCDKNNATGSNMWKRLLWLPTVSESLESTVAGEGMAASSRQQACWQELEAERSHL